MSFFRNCRLLCIAMASVAMWACGRGTASRTPPSAQYSAGAGTATAQLVEPPQDDTSADIRSWVDGQVVTDWPAEVAKRDRAIEGYLDDSDPVRAGGLPDVLYQ